MHVSFVPRDEVTNDLERPYRTNIRVVNGVLVLAIWGVSQGFHVLGYFAFGPIGRKDGVSLVLFLLSTFKVHNRDC